jgi:hypothetical protein
MPRPIAALGALALLSALPTVAFASVPQSQYQVISSRTADAAFSLSDGGCLQTSVFVSSSQSIFGGRPGPVNKQGLSGVLLVVEDTCQPREGKHFPAVLSLQAQDMIPLVTTARMDRASANAIFQTTDEVSGDPISVTLDLTWMLDGTMQHDPSHAHHRRPGAGVVNGHENDKLGNATAWGSVTVGSAVIALPATSDAHLQLIRGGCQVIVWPHATSDELDCI